MMTQEVLILFKEAVAAAAADTESINSREDCIKFGIGLAVATLSHENDQSDTEQQLYEYSIGKWS